MKAFKIILLFILLIVIGVAAYVGIGYTKAKSGTQKDLGVKYTMADYDRAVSEKAGVEVSVPEDIYFNSSFKSEGSKQIDQTFTDAEISAIQNYSNEKKGPFKNVQIHFIGNDQVEGSGLITDPRVNAPVYVKGTIKQTGSKSVSLDLQKLEVGSFNIPSALQTKISDEFVKTVNNILSGINGLSVDKIEIIDGSVRFVGSVPAKVTAN